MRIADIFTVKSDYPKRGCYWVFKTNDESYRVSYDKKYGWLSKGEQAMFSIDLSEVKIGFKEDDSSFGSDWHVAPTKVKTDRSVLITSKGKIEQPAEREFPDPSTVRTVNFMEYFDNTIKDTTRTIILAALGKIPTVGGVVEGLVSFIWPETKPKVEDLISESESRMKTWVHGQIAAYERQELQNRLSGLRSNLKEYLKAKDPDMRKRKFDICLGFFNYAKDFFIKDKVEKYTAGTISLAFDLATMHLALLRERVVHTKEIYGNELVDLAEYKKDLKETIETYQRFIKDVAIPGEMLWRNEMMEVKDIPADIIGQAATIIRDYSTHEVQGFYKGTGRYGGDQSVLARYYQHQARHSYLTALEANIGDPAKLWTLLDPDQANTRPIPLDRVVWVGPCTGLVNKSNNEHGATDRVLVEDRSGIIKKIFVREYNEVDFLQFFYEGYDGGGIGNRNGGEAHTIEVPTGVFIERVETWWDWELSGIKFHFTNGTSTGVLGNRTGMGRSYQSASYPGHRLSTIRMEGHGQGVGKNAISFGFSPLPNYYDVKPK
jgi:hypothetical protein